MLCRDLHIHIYMNVVKLDHVYMCVYIIHATYVRMYIHVMLYICTVFCICRTRFIEENGYSAPILGRLVHT